MLKLDGAFTPVSTQRGTGYCKPSVSPPTRFVSAQLSGGLKILYKHLGDVKNLAPHKKHGEIKIVIINTALLMIRQVITVKLYSSVAYFL